jgi:large subunit ribosomal protein L15
MSEKDTNIMALNSISNQGTAQNRKRVGRGMGSGTGKTAGRGHKGQKSRTGGGVRPGFEGGQMPLQMRLPKFGFSSRKNNHLKEVNVKNIDGLDLVTIETLKEKKIISKAVKKVKIFGTFDLTSKVNVEGIKVTKGAKASIEKAGGTIAELKEKTELKKFEKKDKESK